MNIQNIVKNVFGKRKPVLQYAISLDDSCLNGDGDNKLTDLKLDCSNTMYSFSTSDAIRTLIYNTDEDKLDSVKENPIRILSFEVLKKYIVNARDPIYIDMQLNGDSNIDNPEVSDLIPSGVIIDLKDCVLTSDDSKNCQNIKLIDDSLYMIDHVDIIKLVNRKYGTHHLNYHKIVSSSN